MNTLKKLKTVKCQVLWDKLDSFRKVGFISGPYINFQKKPEWAQKVKKGQKL